MEETQNLFSFIEDKYLVLYALSIIGLTYLTSGFFIRKEAIRYDADYANKPNFMGCPHILSLNTLAWFLIGFGMMGALLGITDTVDEYLVFALATLPGFAASYSMYKQSEAQAKGNAETAIQESKKPETSYEVIKDIPELKYGYGKGKVKLNIKTDGEEKYIEYIYDAVTEDNSYIRSGERVKILKYSGNGTVLVTKGNI